MPNGAGQARCKRRLYLLVRPSSCLDAGEGRVLVIARVVPSLMHLETRVAQNTPPRVQREYPHGPVIGFNPKASVFANEIQDRRFVLLIRGVGVVHILDEDNVHSVPRGRGGAGLVLLECLGRHVRSHNQDAARVQMGVCGAERRNEVCPAFHVRDRIVHEHGIKSPAESARPHITLDERALGIQFHRLRKHGGAQIDTGDVELPLQVQDVLPAPAPYVQQGGCRAPGVLPDQTRDVLTVVRVFSGGIAPQRPQPRQVCIEPAGILPISSHAECST